MFQCPSCNETLVRAKGEVGICWICRTCDGRAVNLSVLRKAVDKTAIDRIWRAVAQQEGKPGCGCPSCARPMQEVPAGPSEFAPPIDVCRSCQFVWFDANEFDSLPARQDEPEPDQKKQDELPQAAREAMAKMQMKSIQERARSSDFGDEAPAESWKTVAAFFGVPVEFDANPLSRVPWLTWSLLAVIAGFSISAFSTLDTVIVQYGLIPVEAWRSGGVTFLSSFFLHGGWIHLIFNLYFLWIFGDNVEDYLGTFCYAQLILFATLMGGTVHVLFDPRPEIACVGASGGISGMVVFYALQFPKIRLGFLWRFWWHFYWLKIPASAAAVVWLATQTYGAWNQVQGFTNVSALAHLGGAGVGFIYWLIWRNK